MQSLRVSRSQLLLLPKLSFRSSKCECTFRKEQVSIYCYFMIRIDVSKLDVRGIASCVRTVGIPFQLCHPTLQIRGIVGYQYQSLLLMSLHSSYTAITVDGIPSELASHSKNQRDSLACTSQIMLNCLLMTSVNSSITKI